MFGTEVFILAPHGCVTKPMHCELALHAVSQPATAAAPVLPEPHPPSAISVSQPSEGPFRFLLGVRLYVTEDATVPTNVCGGKVRVARRGAGVRSEEEIDAGD